MSQLPKVNSAEWRGLWQRLTALLSPEVLAALSFEVLDRKRAERLLGRLTRGPKAGFGNLERAQLIMRLVRLAVQTEAGAYELVRALDRACAAELRLVASLAPDEVGEQLGSHAALRFRRQGARLVWALARDQRERVVPVVEKVVGQFVSEARRLDQARRALLDKGAESELRALEAAIEHAAERAMLLEDRVLQFEEERARLLAEAGRREAALKLEQEQNKQLAARLLAQQRGAQRPVTVAPKRLPKERSRGEWQGKLEAELQEARERVRELEEDNQELSERLERLRELHVAAEPRRQSSLVRAGPLVAPPKRPVSKDPTPRVGVFLDVANLAGAGRRLFDGPIDFGALLDLVAGGRRLVEARAYVIDKGSPGFDAFSRAMRKAGFRVLVKKPKVFPDGTVKADWDVGIAVDLLNLSSKLDVAVLGSGDGDLVPPLRVLRQQGVRVEVASFAERTAADLKGVADLFVELDAAVLER